MKEFGHKSIIYEIGKNRNRKRTVEQLIVELLLLAADHHGILPLRIHWAALLKKIFPPSIFMKGLNRNCKKFFVRSGTRNRNNSRTTNC